MERIEQIEQYLLGGGTPQARAAFEAELQQDPALRGELESYRLLIEGIERAGARQFEQQLAGWEARARAEEAFPARESEGGGRIRSLNWMRYAAAAAVLLLLGLFWVLRPQPAASPEALFAEHFSPYEDILQQRGGAQQALELAMQAYNAQQYAAAAPQLEALADSLPAAALYAGISRLATGEPAAAENLLLRARNANPLLAEVADWYLALAALRAGDLSRAKTRLQAIAAQSGAYRSREAAALLKSLSR